MFVLPFIGGILCIIAFFTPYMTFLSINPSSYWFWGLEYIDGDSIGFNTERIDILITGIIIGLLLLICGIILVQSANAVRREWKSFEDQNKTWIRFPSIAIFGAITWIIYTSIFGEEYFGYDFWDYFRINFGLIGAFSGGFLTLLGYFFNKVVRNTNAMSYFVTQPRKSTIIPHKKFPPPEIQKAQQLEHLNYCPTCGFKLEVGYKFCPQCGFSFI
ncbi:MAG: zinc ribbon domain-containing protein [Promethearchaeota archaeon]